MMPLEVASFGLALTTTRSPSGLRLIGRCVSPLLQAAWPTTRQVPQETVLSQMYHDRGGPVGSRGQALPLFTLSRNGAFCAGQRRLDGGALPLNVLSGP
jgi:hypothetical protein